MYNPTESSVSCETEQNKRDRLGKGGTVMAEQGQATMKVEEAAKLLGISRAAAYRAVRAGHIPAVHIGRTIRVPRAPVERMLSGEPAAMKDVKQA